MPASTSPAPAVASQGGALEAMVARPSGAATTVSGPLSSTTAPLRAAAARTRSSFERLGCLLLISLNNRGNSPSCGVSTTCGSGEALIASNRRSGAAAKLVSASASSTSPRCADNAVRTRSRVRSPTPAPGPITRALRRISVSSSANSTTVSTARTITAVSAAALTASASRGDASVTSPAPARRQPRAASRAAPVAAISPDTTTAWPRAYLWPSIRGTGNDSAQALRNVLERLRLNFGEHAGVDADIGDADPAAAMHPARQQQMRRLAAEERHGLGGVDGDAHHGAGGAVDAARQVDARTGAPLALIASIMSKRVALDRPVEPGAEQRIDDQRRLADRLRIERQHRILPAPSPRRPRRPAGCPARTTG